MCRDAVDQPSRVMLPPHMQKALAAARTGTWHEEDVAVRRKARFRMPTPGPKATIACNLLLFWILLTVRV